MKRKLALKKGVNKDFMFRSSKRSLTQSSYVVYSLSVVAQIRAMTSAIRARVPARLAAPWRSNTATPLVELMVLGGALSFVLISVLAVALRG